MRHLTLFLVLILISCSLDSYAQVNLSQGLIGHYPFDGNSNDISGNNYNLSVFTSSINNPTSIPDNNGVPSSAYQLDTALLTASGSAANLTNNYAFSFWFNPNFPSTSDIDVIALTSNNNINNKVALSFNVLFATSKLEVSVKTSDNTPPPSFLEETNSVLLPYNSNTEDWAHIAVQRDADSIKFYKNGTFVDMITLSTPSVYVHDETRILGSFTDCTFSIDELRIYNRALNNQEITALYNAGVTSVGKLKKQDLAINVYPTPSHEIVNIDLNKQDDYTLEVYDLKGQQLQVQNIQQATQHQLDLGQLPSGQYILKISTADYYTTKKLIKQ